MGEADGGDLGQVHVAAAAQADEGVGPVVAGGGDALVGRLQRRLGLAAGEDLDGDAGLAERGVDRLEEPGLEDQRVGDDQGALDALAHGQVAELAGGAAAEQQVRRGVERPGGAHGGLRDAGPPGAHAPG